jgi:competence protein ComGF
MRRTRCGLTLIEGLIALSLMVIITAALVESARICRHFFFKFKETQEINQEVWASQDRLRRDLNKAGLGLEPCLASGLLLAVESKASGFSIYSREASFPLQTELAAGSIIVPLNHHNSISRGQLIALVEDNRVELFKVDRAEKNRLFLNQPLKENYSSQGMVLAIEEVFYSYDQGNKILRRKVNASPAQPLLEKVISFSWSNEESGPIKIKLTLDSPKEMTYEISVLPKNALIAQRNLH